MGNKSARAVMQFHMYTAEQGYHPTTYQEVLNETRVKTAAVTAATIQLN